MQLALTLVAKDTLQGFNGNARALKNYEAREDHQMATLKLL